MLSPLASLLSERSLLDAWKLKSEFISSLLHYVFIPCPKVWIFQIISPVLFILAINTKYSLHKHEKKIGDTLVTWKSCQKLEKNKLRKMSRQQEKSEVCGYCELNVAPLMYSVLYQKRKIPLFQVMCSSVVCFSFSTPN